MKKITIVVIFLLAFGFGISSAQSSLMISGSDNQLAVKRLYEWLNSRGLEVTMSSNGNYLIYEDDITMVIVPKMSERGLDRLIVYSYFSVLDNYKGSSLLFEMINNKLNNEWNFAAFYMDEGGDLDVRSQITFMDYIDYEEIKQFLKWYNSSVVDALTADEVKGFLK